MTFIERTNPVSHRRRRNGKTRITINGGSVARPLILLDMCQSEREAKLNLPARKIFYQPFVDRNRYTSAALKIIRANKAVEHRDLVQDFIDMGLPIRKATIKLVISNIAKLKAGAIFKAGAI